MLAILFGQIICPTIVSFQMVTSMTCFQQALQFLFYFFLLLLFITKASCAAEPCYSEELCYAAEPCPPQKTQIKIGVLSHRGNTLTLEAWQPTAAYLSQKLPAYEFIIKPLDFDKVDMAVEKDEVDFVLVNPGMYVNLEYKYRVSRLATMSNLRGNASYKVFGGVIFVRRDRTDINTLEDIRGKHFMAVDRVSLGGFQMAWRELNAKGIHLYRDMASVEFGGTHDDVVNAVVDGDVDVGTVRTDILERMALEGDLDLSVIRIINLQEIYTFPFRHSTRLYPEWPFSKVQQTSDDLAKKVALALFKMPHNHPAAQAGKYASWDLPLDYQEVHALFQELKLPPYDEIAKFTLEDAIKKYWYWTLLALLTLFVMGLVISSVIKRNKRLKRAQHRMERHYKRLLNSVGDGIYGVDLKGNCTFVNKAMERLTGWSSYELIGCNQHVVLHHTHADGSQYRVDDCPVFMTMKDHAARYVDNDLFWKKDGTAIAVEYSCTAVRGGGNDVIGSIVVFRDITERKQIKEKNREHQQQLAHVARLSILGEMASGIAHELNQPLTVINNYARACVRMLDSNQGNGEQCTSVMEKISSQAERAGAIIKHMRHFGHKNLPDKRAVKIARMFDVVLELMHWEIERKEINFTLKLDPSVIWVFAQDTQIEQVIVNLVRNAIDAMACSMVEERELVVRTTRKPDDQVEIRVIDSGAGLDETVMEHIFDPFVTTKETGMGLGLSISQGIVEAHGDYIRIEKNEDKGVSFIFHLPIVELE
ncbi:MAG TPA: PAS domain S-box protein [Thiothrix sp.]|nr:PAS domain S-box protein [Thiothrix sp.]